MAILIGYWLQLTARIAAWMSPVRPTPVLATARNRRDTMAGRKQIAFVSSARRRNRR
jgi:hypothetical protein